MYHNIHSITRQGGDGFDIVYYTFRIFCICIYLLFEHRFDICRFFEHIFFLIPISATIALFRTACKTF